MRGVYFSAVLVVAQTLLPAPLPEIAVPPHDGRLRFAVIGDEGLQTRTIASAVSTVAAEEPLDFIVLAGDNVYPCGVKSASDPRWSVLTPLSRLGIPLFPVLGNHDECGNAAAEIGAPLPEWSFPARQYAIRGGVADFAMIETAPYAAGRSHDAEDAIREVFATSTAPWHIAVGHHTIRSSGWHGRFPRAQARRMLGLLGPLRDAHVELYICGHDHHEELIDEKPLLLISGAGSDPVPIVRLRRDTLFPRRHALVEHIGFAVVEVTAGTLRVRFYDWRGRASSGWFTFDLSARR